MRQLTIAVAILMCGVSVFAEDQRQAANDFVDAHDKQLASRTEVSNDRTTMANAAAGAGDLNDSVKEFFNDRADIEKFATQKAMARDEMFAETSVILPPVVKPAKSMGSLQQDVQYFISSFDLFRTKDAAIQQAIEGIRSAIALQDAAALNTACATYFQARRDRRNARDGWTAALKYLKKGVAFSVKLKAQKYDSDSLKGYTEIYLAQRAAWVDLGTAIENDLNAMRAASSGDGSQLQAAVTTFLTDRLKRRVKAQELAKIRASMQKNNPVKSVPNVFKSLFTKTGNAKIDEEEVELDQSVDHAGS
jgi:hypothetical protein